MDLSIEFTGDIVERQELLNGTQIVTLSGESADGEWQLVGELAWNVGLVDFSGEGDITLSREDGAELLGTLIAAAVTEIGESDLEVDHRIHIDYEIDGGSGEFESAIGAMRASGELAGDIFRLAFTISATRNRA